MASPGYKAISRRPPFTGLSSANKTAGDYSGATKAENILFSGSNDNSVHIKARPGWRKLLSLSDGYTDIVEYQEPSIAHNVADTFDSRSANVYGLQLFGTKLSILLPARIGFRNASERPVQIRLTEQGTAVLSVAGYDVSATRPTPGEDTVTTFSSLVSILAEYGITSVDPDDYTKMSVTSPLWPDVETGIASVSLSTIEEVTTSEKFFYIPCRGLFPVNSVALGSYVYGQASSLPKLAYKAKLNQTDCVAGYPTSANKGSFQVEGLYFSNGHIFDPAHLVAETSASAAAGASYFNVAVQVRVFPFDADLGNGDESFQVAGDYYGPLSTRQACVGVSPITFSLSTGGVATLADKYVVDETFRVAVTSGSSIYEANGFSRHGRTLCQSSPPAYVVTAGALDNRFLSAPTTGPVAVGVKVVFWRTKAQTSAEDAETAPLYKVAEATVNSDGVYIDSSADADLTEIYLPRPIEPEMQGFSGRSTAAVLHQTRAVVGLENGLVVYSLPGEHLNFAPATMSLWFDEGIQALASDDTDLYVFTRSGIYTVSGSLGTLDASVRKISDLTLHQEVASCQPHVATSATDTFFIASDGYPYLIRQGAVARIGDTRTEVKFFGSALNYNPAVADTNLTVTSGASRLLTAYVPKLSSFVFGQVGESTLSLYDSKLRLTTITLPDTLLDLCTASGKLIALLRDSSGTAIWELTENFKTDNGESFTFRYASQWEDLEDPRTEKTFARLHVDLAEGASQNADLTIKAEFDYLPGKPGVTKVYPLRDSQGWGNRPWGSFAWGDKNQAHISLPLTNEKHRSMRVLFESEQNLAISGWSIEVQGAGAHSKNGDST
jgi:hypothetical protein